MVKVKDVLQREGENGAFALLQLEGELELVQSQSSGKFYATVRKCTIPCTLDYDDARAFIGREMPGCIQKVLCEPYEYTVESTGEVIELSHRWAYFPEGVHQTPVVEMSVSRLTA